MQQTATLVAVVFGSIGLVLGATLLYRHLGMALFTVRILRSEPTPIESIPESGAVELQGETAIADDRTVRSPFSGRECLAYEVESRERQGGGLSHWETLRVERDGVPFLLEDDTGSVRVEDDPRLSLDEVELDSEVVPAEFREETPAAAATTSVTDPSDHSAGETADVGREELAKVRTEESAKVRTEESAKVRTEESAKVRTEESAEHTPNEISNEPAGEQTQELSDEHGTGTAADPDPAQSPRRLVSDDGPTRTFVEKRLDVGATVRLYGVAMPAPTDEWGRQRIDGRVTRSERVPLIVSDGSRVRTAWRLGRRSVLWSIIGGAFLAYAVGVLTYGLVLFVM